MFEIKPHVIAASRRSAEMQSESPITLIYSCVDHRANDVANAAIGQYECCFFKRNPGAFLAHPNATFADAAVATLYLLAPKLERVIHIGHDDCAYSKRARNAADLSDEDPVDRLILQRGIVTAKTDRLYSLEQAGNLSAHLDLLKRKYERLVEFHAIFVTASGDPERYDPACGDYLPI